MSNTAKIQLRREWFTQQPWMIVDEDTWQVTLFRYPSGIEALTLAAPHGSMTVLPFMGQMIWDLTIDGVAMGMEDAFTQPRRGQTIVDTYGCFAFHSGLLANGCPTPADNHQLHGEFPCSDMDTAWISVAEDQIVIGGSQEYVKGFGNHYLAEPQVSWRSDESAIEMSMKVTNLSARHDMPLQYMCHMNHAYIAGATLEQDIPADAFVVRTSIPDHVKPTAVWQETIDALAAGKRQLTCLDDESLFDPEVVFFADNLPADNGAVTCSMVAPSNQRLWVTFDPRELPVLTRWFFSDGDQRVAAFALPGTSRPEGQLAAREAGTLIQLAPGETKSFTVKTGLSS